MKDGKVYPWVHKTVRKIAHKRANNGRRFVVGPFKLDFLAHMHFVQQTPKEKGRRDGEIFHSCLLLTAPNLHLLKQAKEKKREIETLLL